jgi:hypothetical protein
MPEVWREDQAYQMTPTNPICLPPAPLNGGALDTAPRKVGEWIWQPKIDDWRAIIHTPTGTVWNQYGQLSSISGKFETALRHLQEGCEGRPRLEWLDVGMMENRNDLMRGCIVVLDLIEANTPFIARRAVLRICFPVLPVDVADLLRTTGGQVRDSIYLINQWENVETPADALKRQQWLKSQNEHIGHKFYEGLVAKKENSPYPFFQSPKTQTPDWIKHRFDQ